MRRARSWSDEDEEEEESPDFDKIMVEDMSYAMLRHALKQRGVAVPKGKKVELQAQLRHAREEESKVAALRLRTEESDFMGVPDVLLRALILSRLSAQDVAFFSATCRAAYALCNVDTLWEALLPTGDDIAPVRKRDLDALYQVLGKPTLPRVCEGKAKYILLDNELLCTQCRENFYEPLNHDRACEFHTEDFVPRSQWRSEDMKWMCCGMEDEADPGCAVSCHSTLEEDAGGKTNYEYWW